MQERNYDRLVLSLQSGRGCREQLPPFASQPMVAHDVSCHLITTRTKAEPVHYSTLPLDQI